jgi:hypothetical protein
MAAELVASEEMSRGYNLSIVYMLLCIGLQ